MSSVDEREATWRGRAHSQIVQVDDMTGGWTDGNRRSSRSDLSTADMFRQCLVRQAPSEKAEVRAIAK